MFCFFGLLALMSCQKNPFPQRGTWNGTLRLPEATIPFRMELNFSDSKPTGNFIVGNEKTSIPEISRNGDALTFSFSEYGAEMRAVWDGHELKGDYLRLRASGTKTFPFSASPELAPYAGSGSPPVEPPLGTFEVLFENRKPEDGVTLARLWKSGDSYLGTFIAPDGDYGLLEGMPTALGIQLNRVTGWQAIAIELQAGGAGWSGKFHAASNDKPLAFRLKPATNPEPAMPTTKQTAMKNPESSFAFACISSSGDTVRNTDDRFKGKALAVDIMGTWCHNCMDESPVLQELHEKYGKDGFEVVGLSFEIKEDATLGRKNLALYRDRFGITYPLLYCGSVDDASQDKQIRNQLQNFFAFPTTLFIDKKGKVQSVHSGFRGPGTGDQFPLQIQKLHELAAQALR